MEGGAGPKRDTYRFIAKLPNSQHPECRKIGLHIKVQKTNSEMLKNTVKSLTDLDQCTRTLFIFSRVIVSVECPVFPDTIIRFGIPSHLRYWLHPTRPLQ